MATTTKYTKREVLTMTLTALKDGERTFPDELTEALIEYAENELFLLDKKTAKAKSTQSKTQKENVKIKETIVEVLENFAKPVTVTEMLKDPWLEGISNQKCSALLMQLIKDGKVVRTTEKKIAYFALATADEDIGAAVVQNMMNNYLANA